MTLPYIASTPIKDPTYFHGYQGLVKWLFSIVDGNQPQSVSLLGLRKSGKTSLLYHLAHPQVLRRYVSNPDTYLPLYIDLSRCSSPQMFFQQVYAGLLQGFDDAVAEEEKEVEEPDAADITWLLGLFPGYRVLLLLDNFDRLKKDTFDPDFLSQLRSLVVAPDTDLAIITASFQSIDRIGERMGLPSTSPFYNIFFSSYAYLTGFIKSEAVNLIQQPAEQKGVCFTKGTVEKILEMAGTHPYLLQKSASKLFFLIGDEKPFKIDTFQKELIEEVRPFLEGLWKDLGKEQRLLLSEMGRKGGLSQEDFSSPSQKEAMHILKNYGLVTEKKGIFQINGLILNTWVRGKRARQQKKRIPQSPKKAEGRPVPMKPEKELLVFLSHASEDKPKVRRLYKRLKQAGFDPWLDDERILPGQDWNHEIEKALRGSQAILLCFSSHSIQKEGYIQREYKRAMRFQEEKPEETIFVIPVRFDACEIPFEIQALQRVDYPRQFDRLVMALKKRMDTLA